MPVSLGPEPFTRLFPFHLVVDRELRIVEYGPSLQKVIPRLQAGAALNEYFAVGPPHLDRDFDDLASRPDELLLLTVSSREELTFKGQALELPGEHRLVLVLAPWITEFQTLQSFGLEPADLPPHLGANDVLFLLQQQRASLEDTMHLSIELSDARDQALQASKVKGEFLATMSHEIRTPLNAVLGFLELLLLSEMDEEQRSYAEAAHNSGRMLLALINDILDYSKIEAGKLTLESIPVSPGALVQHVAVAMRVLAQSKQVEIHEQIGPDVPPYVMGDPIRLQQILTNLTGNAVKFTKQGDVWLRARVEGDELIFEVRDTGIGISEEARERLFQPFTQADASTTRQHGGTGLGLSISRRLADLMGGKMECDSTLGQGSTFRCRLPCLSADPEQVKELLQHSVVATAARRREGDPSVLVVDDNAVNRRLAERMLSKLGLRSSAAEGGEQALAICEQESFSIILMDCQMPGIDGFETTRRLRATAGPNQSAPVLALTANAFGDIRDRCLECGMNDYLAKPISLKSLETILDKWLSAGALKSSGSPSRAGDARPCLTTRNAPKN
jgi:signal transduction histidine kinase/FixJ family two-component response regulator